MTEKDVEMISAALGDKPPYNRLGLLGITAAISIALGGGGIGLYYSALEKAIDELPFDARGAFILLAMTQEEYRGSEFYINSTSSNYYNEMTGPADKSGISDYIRDIVLETSSQRRRLTNPEANGYYETIVNMIAGCLSDTLDVNAVRSGYIACLEILGQIPPSQARPSDLTKVDKIGPEIRIKTGAGYDVPTGVKRQ
jgi:hypothetical protein